MPLEPALSLHIWGAADGLLSLTPECIACAWYSNLAAPSCKIVASSNINLGELPALVDQNRVVVASGFIPIVRHLKGRGLDLNSKLSEQDSAYNECLITFINNKMSLMSLFLLFLDHQVYDKVTRPTISNSVGFPLQYNVALKMSKMATVQCAQIGLLPSKAETGQPNKPEPTLSKLHGQMQQQQNEKAEMLQRSVQTMRSWTAAKEIYDSLPQNIGDYLFQDSLSSADLLLAAHILVQTHEFSACDNSLQKAIKNNYGQLDSYASRVADEAVKGLKVCEAVGKDVPTFVNWVTGLLPAPKVS